MGDCPTCGRRMDMIVGLVEGPMPEMPDLPPRIEVFKETFYRMRDANDKMRPVYDAAMAARKGGAFYMAITLLREHGLHDYAELFVPLEMACLRRAYEEVEHE